jgi:hypothetical protein
MIPTLDVDIFISSGKDGKTSQGWTGRMRIWIIWACERRRIWIKGRRRVWK